MPWVDVSADFITDLPLSNGFDSILTVVDQFSKETEFILCNKTATVTVRGRGLVFSIVHLPPLTSDSPFTFTVLIVFFANTFRYVVW